MALLLNIETKCEHAAICAFCPYPCPPHQDLMSTNFSDGMLTKDIERAVSYSEVTKLIDDLKFAHNAWTLSDCLFFCNMCFPLVAACYMCFADSRKAALTEGVLNKANDELKARGCPNMKWTYNSNNNGFGSLTLWGEQQQPPAVVDDGCATPLVQINNPHAVCFGSFLKATAPRGLQWQPPLAFHNGPMERQSWIQFTVVHEVPGVHMLQLSYASADPRPVDVRINGAILLTRVGRETTGGFAAKDIKSFDVGTVDLGTGKMVLVEFRAQSFLSHLSSFALTPLAGEVLLRRREQAATSVQSLFRGYACRRGKAASVAPVVPAPAYPAPRAAATTDDVELVESRPPAYAPEGADPASITTVAEVSETEFEGMEASALKQLIAAAGHSHDGVYATQDLKALALTCGALRII